jgi:hypothetical protein
MLADGDGDNEDVEEWRRGTGKMNVPEVQYCGHGLFVVARCVFWKFPVGDGDKTVARHKNELLN